jgi:hypothetical protein
VVGRLGALGLERAVRVPLWPYAVFAELLAEQIQRLRVFKNARIIPVRIEYVIGRVIVVRRVIRGCRLPGRLARSSPELASIAGTPTLAKLK